MVMDDNGNIISKAKATHTIGKDGQVLDASGKALMINGKKVFKNAKGELVYADGTAVTDPLGRKMVMNADGEIVSSEQGKYKTGTNGQVLDASGKAVMINGKKVFKNAKGELVYADGTAVTDPLGRKMFLDANGNIISNPAKSLKIGANGEVLDQLGQPMTINGKKVFKNAKGELVYADGTAVLDDEGNPLSIDQDGNVVNIKGELVSASVFDEKESKFYDGQTFGKVGKFKTKNDNPASKKIGAINLTEEGFILDEKGRPLQYKGKSIRVDKSGKVLDENGMPIVDANGNHVYLNDRGEFVDSDGQLIEGLPITNGDGELVDSAGNAITQTARIGESDLYLNKDGYVLGEDGSPLTYKGKKIRVDDEGKVLDEDGNPILDENGNAVYINKDGTFTNKNGKPSLISIEDSQGRHIDSSGKIAGKNATNIKGTNLKRTDAGALVDSANRAIKINGETAFLSNGELISARGRPIRYKGRNIILNEKGELVDSKGELLLNQDGKPLTMDDLTKRSTQDDYDATRPVPEKIFEQVQPEEPVIENNNTKKVQSSLDQEIKKEDEPRVLFDVSKMNDASKKRLNERYLKLANRMRSEADEIINGYKPSIKSQSLVYSTPQNASDELEVVDTVESEADSKKENNPPTIIAKAGESFYSATNMAINTDYFKSVSVDLIGLRSEHPLYKGVAKASVELRYDRAVLSFYQVCADGVMPRCVEMSGVGIDPSTASAGLAAEVDDHFWYRYGGLFFSSLLQGGADAVNQSVERVEENDANGGKVTSSKVEGDKLILTAAGAVGEAFVPVFANRVNRPYTIKMPLGFEIGIMLMEDIEATIPDQNN